MIAVNDNAANRSNERFAAWIAAKRSEVSKTRPIPPLPGEEEITFGHPGRTD